MIKKILVTGGAGFIGSHTADALLKKGYSVRVLDNLAKPVHLLGKPSYLNKKAEFMLGDVRNKRSWEKALKGVDVVYHLAAYQDYLPNFSKYFDVNAKGTALLYEVIVEKNLPVRKVIVASSQAIYGEGKYRCKKGHIIFPGQRNVADLTRKKWDFSCPKDGSLLVQEWVNEEDFINPHNQYGISKYAQEKIAINLGKRYGIPSIAMRYSIVQGSRQSPFNLYSGALRIFVVNLLAGISPTIYEDGNQIRDFVNIHDVVKANLVVLENKKADYEVFNVGGGKKWKVIDFYNAVAKTLKSDLEPCLDNSFRSGDTRNIASSINKIKKIGFAPQFSVEDSIKEYTEWVQMLPYFKRMVAKSKKTMKEKGIIQ